ncbi:MAG: transporter substrate-binding domain-containing protein, partial [Thiotrichaceae bacterium]|nr:transporter substrate-binding domain-containing protein [Thiotrichaceae bacterium]
AFDGYFPPNSFINNSGQLTGFSYDTLQLISQKLNMKIEIDDRIQWQNIYKAALDRKIDVVATMVKRPEREHQFAFTGPYVFKSLVIITHKSNQKIKTRGDLSRKTIAPVEDYQYTQRILKDFPDITPFYVDNMDDALIAVETRQADAAISFFAASYFLQDKYLLSNIKVSAFYDRNSANESIAVRKDWPILVGILQKGLNSITEAENQAIINQWHLTTELPVDYETIKKIAIALLRILLILLRWIGQIKRQNRRIKIAQNKLLIVNSELKHFKENLENQVLQRTMQLQNSEQKYRSLVENLQDEYFFYQHDLDGIYTYLSPSTTTILGYSTDQFSQHYSTFLTNHPDNAKTDEYTRQCLNGKKV